MIAGGSEQGLEVGMTLAVKQRGKLIKDPQYGGMIELPRSEVAKIKVLGFFGAGVDAQGSVCELSSGTLEGKDFQMLVVEEIQ
jgi:hypothetical protein